MEATMTPGAPRGQRGKRHRRLPLSQVPLPDTTPSYELFNCVSHALGVGLGMFALGWMFSAARGSLTPNVVGGILVYGLSLIALYAVSATYHGLPKGLPKRALRVADHCTIYLLIAGCYAPLALIAFWGRPFVPALLAVEWGLAAAGIALNAWNLGSRAVKAFSLASYLIMGWAIVLVPVGTLLEVGSAWLPWVALGGVAYTVGIAFYVRSAKRPRLHCVWHVFVLLGSALQLVGFIQTV